MMWIILKIWKKIEILIFWWDFSGNVVYGFLKFVREKHSSFTANENWNQFIIESFWYHVQYFIGVEVIMQGRIH